MHWKLWLRKWLWDTEECFWDIHLKEDLFCFGLTLFILVRDSVCTVSETKRPLSGFTASRSWIVLDSSVGATCCKRMSRRTVICTYCTANCTLANKVVCPSYKKVVAFHSGHGRCLKENNPAPTGNWTAVFSKLTDWGIPANVYYNSVSLFVKCYIMRAVPIPLSVKVLILTTLCSLSSDSGPQSLSSGLHKEYPVYGDQV
jgi:hypothetical protein